MARREMRRQINFLKLARRGEAGLYYANKVIAMVAAVVLISMMLLTIADVIGRYFLRKPITGTYEIVGLLLVCAGTWGWGYCQMDKAHVSVTLLLDRLPKKVQTILRSLAYLIGLTGFSLICWRMLLRTLRYFSLTRGGVTETLGIPYYPFMLALAISAGLMALILLIDLWHSLAEVTRE